MLMEVSEGSIAAWRQLQEDIEEERDAIYDDRA
jgi:hypothetical protein